MSHKPVKALMDILDKIEKAIPDLPRTKDRILFLLTETKPFEEDRFLDRFRQAKSHMKNFVNAVEKDRIEKASLHFKKVRKIISPVTNDYPFIVGDKVSITRIEHGWIDGMISGRVKSRSEDRGRYIYVVTGEDGIDYTINHTRDISPS